MPWKSSACRPGLPSTFPPTNLPNPPPPIGPHSWNKRGSICPFWWRTGPEGYFTVVEGAGGALVPLNEREDMIDLALALDLPMVVVATTGLGTLHHTLATVQAIRNRGASIAGVLLNGSPHGENARQIRDRGGVDILGRIPELYPTDAQSVGELIQRWKMGDWMDPLCRRDPDPCEANRVFENPGRARCPSDLAPLHPAPDRPSCPWRSKAPTAPCCTLRTAPKSSTPSPVGGSPTMDTPTRRSSAPCRSRRRSWSR
jgi:hypothetical protein